jgi:nitroreductase/NAD-dependent dihydropyrimidine dehydrogenase PreA subunit
MEYLIIDRKKCKKDGICSRECPALLIKMQGEEGYPEMVPGGEDICILCGHCVAVCPNKALSHKKIPISQCTSIEKEQEISRMQAIQFLRSRRTIRFFKDIKIEKEKIQQLIEIARYAPTGGNNQLLNWTVYSDKEKIKKLTSLTIDWMKYMLKETSGVGLPSYFKKIVSAYDAGTDRVLREAPAVIIVSSLVKTNSGLVDISLALSYLDIIAPKFGLGTCWAGLLSGALQSFDLLKKEVGLSKHHVHSYAMMIGYPKIKYHRMPERKSPEINWK